MKRFILFFAVVFSCLTAQAQTSYAERDSLSRDDGFRGRVTFAMLEAASAILADTQPSSRRNYRFAGRVLTEPGSAFWVDQFTFAVLTNPVINGGSTDSDLAFTVNSQFAKLALAWRRERGELEEGEQ
jgi:hypothetical protein